MAVLFNEQQFEQLILRKGKEFGDLVAAEVELEAYKKGNYLEYLFYVYQFCLTLKDNDILFVVKLDDYPSYILQILGVSPSFSLRNNLQNYKYGRCKHNQFSIYIPNGMKDEVLNLFGEIISFKVDINKIFFGENGKYQIGLVQHIYLAKLNKINREALSDIHKDDIAVINYMLDVDHQGYYMPNLYGCVYGNIDLWYSLINVSKPKSLNDLMKISSLASGIFNNRKLLIRHIKEYGLNNIICCREQLYNILCDAYDIPIDRVDNIRFSLSHFHHLSEADELILESNEVPSYIINQLKNIRYLPYACHSVIGVELLYQLTYLKFYYRDDFKASLPKLEQDAYVGPFFYIDSKIRGSIESIKDFDFELRFFDSKESHFFLFNSLNIDGDYGNYPRGRVIYNNYHKKFIVYMDKSLMNKDIKEKIKKVFFLEDKKVIFRRDEHYTHDGL